MSQPTSFIDCRGLSAPLTVLRIKQAVVGRQDCGLPLDVLVDRHCNAPERIAHSLKHDPTDIRLVYSTQDRRALAKAGKGMLRHG
ncbi:hypothetical protein C8J27_10753 [Rhodobacter aestuarii]|uniref:Uncharacterized protein n=1 Tax=Rhodobacter aestuarii TaxID=453582 RepID=A0A1N7NVZ8_9RHOB|nr:MULTISPECIES: hypothetical protein [Rhodobacter]PTV94522.1 hypothetical protein C8J27_10753 [Rhodobacter aestuarii]SIT02389.1 hypothetical protein SAMN05421580_108174 [Rhodobacter aestuarii]SOC12282.1 hypothetical protein SAMN05877809_10652 [Rhodobacter sp. JA431]